MELVRLYHGLSLENCLRMRFVSFELMMKHSISVSFNCHHDQCDDCVAWRVHCFEHISTVATGMYHRFVLNVYFFADNRCIDELFAIHCWSRYQHRDRFRLSTRYMNNRYVFRCVLFLETKNKSIDEIMRDLRRRRASKDDDSSSILLERTMINNESIDYGSINGM